MFKGIFTYYKLFLGFFCFFCIIASFVFYLKNIENDLFVQNKLDKSSPKPFFYNTIGDLSGLSQGTVDGEKKFSQHYTLEFNIVKKQEEAISLLDYLAAKGVEAYYTPVQKDGELMFFIRKGFYKVEKDALNASKILFSQKNIVTKVAKF